MNRKKIIQIIIVAVAFGGTGFVLYNGFHRSATPNPLTTNPLIGAMGSLSAAPGKKVDNSPLLPYGASLNFSKVLDSRPFLFDAVQFQALNATSEVGVPTQDLIK